MSYSDCEIDKKDEISAVSSKRFLSIMDEVDGMHHLGILNDLLFCDYDIVIEFCKIRDNITHENRAVTAVSMPNVK